MPNETILKFDNFDKKNIENVRKMIEDSPIPDKVYTMVIDESGSGRQVKVSKESRKICAKSLLR